jgi:hypothetical protein
VSREDKSRGLRVVSWWSVMGDVGLYAIILLGLFVMLCKALMPSVWLCFVL